MTIPFLTHWAVTSQQGSRRNAMLASTVLTQRRIENTEVEEYLSALAGRADQPVAAHG